MRKIDSFHLKGYHQTFLVKKSVFDKFKN